jgi:hypothetical protein
VRGRVDLIINGSCWLGTAFGAALSVLLLTRTSSLPMSAFASRSS